jgi:hydrogenase maturation protein HypF
VPEPIGLACEGPSVLALGAWYKNTACLTRANHAFVSAHVGDLDNVPTIELLEQTIDHLQEIAVVSPRVIACDLHPDFPSSLLAARLSDTRGLPLIRVQHHHAHIAAVLAEHGIEQPVLGLAIDGTGLGTDGQAWGGEMLRIDGARCQRLASLAPLALVGGDRAAREPWRMASAVLASCGRSTEIARRFERMPAARNFAQAFERPGLCRPTSSLGRVFDAAAALLNLRLVNDFEGQAAMELEACAYRHGPVAPWMAGWQIDERGTLSLLPLLNRLADEANIERGAALFHATLGLALVEWVSLHAKRADIGLVAGGGGCLLNAILAISLRRGLAERDLVWMTPRCLPPNDGGLSLGQAWVALHSKEE